MIGSTWRMALVNKGCLSAIAYTMWILALILFFAVSEPAIIVAFIASAICIMGGFITSEFVYRLNGR